ncbi:hypothetical protein [Vulcanisaeta distributa]|uniref:Uncharacterized protein n=1 Tax=Vulcanisaeta distributa (strain DSM 14429 / JCM 11212 / NBRC 100878 / IC-017) TaxID=572478 RepID=E1QT12_VULDI|nr:hypothetical protein [Vulcanisaeta distributa]ADN50879.1 hypothetical protein Vdis_1493 [Vulcanisaeta distributa DSM 14429]
MDFKIIAVLIIASLLVIAVILIHQLSNINHNEKYKVVNSINNTVNPKIMENYSDDGINYTMVMTEKVKLLGINTWSGYVMVNSATGLIIKAQLPEKTHHLERVSVKVRLINYQQTPPASSKSKIPNQ